MIGIDESGRDGDGRREDILLTYSLSFHLLLLSFFLSFSPSLFSLLSSSFFE